MTNIQPGRATDDSRHTIPFFARGLACFAAGSLMAYAMPPAGLWPMMFLSFSLFYVLLAGHRGARAFFLGWLFGFGYFLIGLSWIGNALLVPGNPYKWVWPLATAGLPVLLAVFTGAAAWAATMIAPLRTWAGYFAFACVMALTEWLRGHILTGFPWNLYGYAWAGSLTMLQSASVLGVYGLGALTVFWATLPGFLIAARSGRHAVSLAVFALITTLNLCWLWGKHRIETTHPGFHDGVVVRIVQPNIAQEDKWNPEKIVDNLHTLVKHSAAEKLPGATTVTIWPETAITDDVAANRSAIDIMAPALFGDDGRHILISGVLRHGADSGTGPEYFNSLVAYGPGMRVLSAYDKNHLVPFGEYIPFQSLIPIAPITRFSGFTPGKNRTAQKIHGLPDFSPLICYEVVFPGAVMPDTPGDADAGWIINATNDAWYGDSAGPYQHMTKSIFRAVEEGRPLARSANTGISVLIDPLGRVLARISYGTAGYVDHALPHPLHGRTPYAIFGDIPLLILLLGTIAVVLMIRHKFKPALDIHPTL